MGEETQANRALCTRVSVCVCVDYALGTGMELIMPEHHPQTHHARVRFFFFFFGKRKHFFFNRRVQSRVYLRGKSLRKKKIKKKTGVYVCVLEEKQKLGLGAVKNLGLDAGP